MDLAWKPNWAETKQHFADWWKGDGLVLGMSGAPMGEAPLEAAVDPGSAPTVAEGYTDAPRRARRGHYHMARGRYCADILPVADTSLGCGTLATFLGSEPEFLSDSVWFHPVMDRDDHPEGRPPLCFDPESRWWKVTEAVLRESAALAHGKYFVGCPDLVENIDILASLRGIGHLLQDMVERPEWVSRKVEEINAAWFVAYDRIYEMIRMEDGSSVYGPHRLWGPGKTAKVECDSAAMFSPAMFEQFVVPGIVEQCAWLDHSLFSIDGHQSLNKLDALLAIDALDAIAWMPDLQVPSSGDPRWYEIYRRILDAGKSVQAYSIRLEDIIPLLDAVGGKGVYALTTFRTEAEAEELMKRAEPYR